MRGILFHPISITFACSEKAERGDTMSLAQRVRDYRYTKGWGPDELASRAAISRTALYQIESGKTELPRAGTLRRIALALDVSMETLLGHAEAALAQSFALPQAAAGLPPTRTRGMSDWYPSEGTPLASMGTRSANKYDVQEGARFAVEHEVGLVSRERELVGKFHELLASPLGEPVARIVEETHRLLPQTRLAAGYD
jgi:transcriptional regulator with XRE-family HTH domain